MVPALMLLANIGALAQAATPDCDLAPGRTVNVVGVPDGETLELADGSFVRLLGVVAPRRPPWWRKPEPWPASEAARKALAALAEGKTVMLHFDASKSDRRGRTMAQVFSGEEPDGRWLQGQLVRRGHVRVYAFADNRACTAALLGLEQGARTAAKGLWANSAYRVLDADNPETVAKRLQSLQIVEGRVASVGRVQRWRFLNFGSDWKTDFTVAVASSDVEAFRQAGIDLEGLAGARLRVRGWIERWNGPAVKVTHPGQIEILHAAPVSDAGSASRGGQ
jgi:endonuclease YncB( thermonuclease family)